MLKPTVCYVAYIKYMLYVITITSLYYYYRAYTQHIVKDLRPFIFTNKK